MTDIYGVIWDMDGVLVDTADAHYQAWKDVLALHDIDFSRAFFEMTFGINNHNLIKKIFSTQLDEKTATEISNQKEIHYREQIKKDLKIFPGVEELLKECKDSGFKQALDTSAPQENIDAIMQLTDLSKYFDELVSTDTLRSKKYPDAYLAASSALELQPENCIVIEDSILGIEGAKKAGMQCIAVATTHPKDKLEDADLVVASINALEVSIFLELFALAREI